MKKYFVLIGLIIFAIILLSIDLEKVLTHLIQADILLIFLAILVVFIVTIIKGIKWKLIVKSQNLNFSTIECIKGFMIGFTLGIITPGRIGDFSRAMYLKKKGNSFFQGISTVFIDRLIDIAILLILSLIAVFLFAQFFGKNIISIELLALIVVGFAIASFIAMRKNLSRIFLKPVYSFFIPQKFKQLTKNSLNSFYEGINKAKQKKSLLFGSVFLGLLAWTLSIIVAFIVLLALNISQIPFEFLFVVVPIITLLEIIPISISGIGTRDAALVFLFSFFAVSAEQAIAYSLIYLFVGYFFVALGGLILFIQNPISLKELRGKNETN